MSAIARLGASAAIAASLVAAACGARVEADEPARDGGAMDASPDSAFDQSAPTDAALRVDRDASPPPPACAPGGSIVVDQENTSVTESAGGPTAQTFVAGRDGYLAELEISMRRCGGDPTDRVRVTVRDSVSDAVLGTAEIADLPARCAGYPSLVASDPGIVVALSKSCVRVAAKSTYRIVLEPLASTIRFGVRGGDGYPAGALERVEGAKYVPSYGDLAFRTRIAP